MTDSPGCGDDITRVFCVDIGGAYVMVKRQLLVWTHQWLLVSQLRITSAGVVCITHSST